MATLSKRWLFWIASTLLLLAGSLFGGAVWAQADRSGQLRLLTAVGNAEVRVAPDLAEVELGVETEAPTAAQAREDNATRANEVVKAIKALGIPEKAIETSNFSIYPVRRFEEEEVPRRGQPPIVGYRVTNVVSVRTEKFDLVPKIIDDSVQAGANRVDSVNFLLRDDTAARQKALRMAVADARQNAREMARELGVGLVRVQSVQQGGVGVTPPILMFGGDAMEAAAPTPIFPGEVTVSASVTLAYCIQ